jgi:hypothetical protein
VRKEVEVKFAVPDSSLFGFDTISCGKSDFPQGSAAYICRIQHQKNNGILFKKR